MFNQWTKIKVKDIQFLVDCREESGDWRVDYMQTVSVIYGFVPGTIHLV